MPVYQVEAYLEDSLQSVLSQTLRDIEIIVVNDQSPDRSQDIIDRLSEKDLRIRSMQMSENSGQGFARNAGLDVAQGKYVFFLDSDDLLADTRVLEECVLAAESTNADLVRVQKAVFIDGESPQTAVNDRLEALFSKEEIIEHPLKASRLLRSWHFWNYLYSRSLLEDNKIRFSTAQWEERYFICKSLKHTRRLKVLSRPGVCYRRRAGSTTSRMRTRADLSVILDAVEGIGLEFPHGEISTILAIQYANLFTGDTPWARRLISEIQRENEEILSRVRHAFSTYSCAHHDVIKLTSTALESVDRAAQVSLFLAAIRASRWDLACIAIRASTIFQSNLYREYISETGGVHGSDLEKALNFYARNGNVKRSRWQWPKKIQHPRLILHIGATKTGSTFIQHLLEHNRPALLRAGVWYPEVGLFWQKSRPHKQAGHALFTQAAVRDDPILRDYLEAGLRTLNGRVHTIVLSSEAFFLQEESHQIVPYLSDYPCDVIVYLRRQDEWANSQYCELVAGGAVNRVSDPIETWLEGDDIQSRIDYLNTLSRFERMVSRQRIKVRVFDRSCLRNGDLVADFADATELPILLEMPRPEGQLTNVVLLSGVHIQLLRQYNARSFAARDDYFSFIEEVSNEIVAWRAARGIRIPKPMLLTSAKRKAILSRLRESNEQIARRWLGREDGLLFDETLSETTGSTDIIHEQEVAMVQAAFERWSGKGSSTAGAQPAPHMGEQWGISRRSPFGRIRVVSYGLFGWRLWGLTPFVRAQVRKRGNAEDLESFNRDPSGYLHSLERPDYQRLAQRLYPERSVLGPGNILYLWVPPLAWLVSKLGGRQCEVALRKDPVLFFRLLHNPVYRTVGRILFPIGEVMPADDVEDFENRA